jgi:cation transport ATPase
VSRRLLALATFAGLVLGALLHVAGLREAGSLAWSVSAGIALLPLSFSVGRSILRRDVGVDAIALVAITAALILGQYLAGAVVALMMSGGNALEEFAAGRARRELTHLLARMPRVAHRHRESTIEEVAVEAVVAGDLIVRAGEVVPVDGVVTGSDAVLDESALTGEVLHVLLHEGDDVRSGTANAGEAFELRATRAAAESAYAGVVRLVRRAETDRPPFVRLADRYAAIFLPISLATAGGALAWSGSAVRFLAVMVVATLILAAPIPFVSGCFQGREDRGHRERRRRDRETGAH